MKSVTNVNTLSAKLIGAIHTPGIEACLWARRRRLASAHLLIKTCVNGKAEGMYPYAPLPVYEFEYIPIIPAWTVGYVADVTTWTP